MANTPVEVKKLQKIYYTFNLSYVNRQRLSPVLTRTVFTPATLNIHKAGIMLKRSLNLYSASQFFLENRLIATTLCVQFAERYPFWPDLNHIMIWDSQCCRHNINRGNKPRNCVATDDCELVIIHGGANLRPAYTEFLPTEVIPHTPYVVPTIPLSPPASGSGSDNQAGQSVFETQTFSGQYPPESSQPAGSSQSATLPEELESFFSDYTAIEQVPTSYDQILYDLKFGNGEYLQ